MLLSSCAGRPLILYPITGKDIYKGTNEGDTCFSAMYLKEVMQVKIERGK
jgi:hypothetical protein